VAGSSRKLAFHAVQDVMEKSYVGGWDEHEARGCKIVFIGALIQKRALRGVRDIIDSGGAGEAGGSARSYLDRRCWGARFHP
jgi:hypothetical protein